MKDFFCLGIFLFSLLALPSCLHTSSKPNGADSDKEEGVVYEESRDYLKSIAVESNTEDVSVREEIVEIESYSDFDVNIEPESQPEQTLVLPNASAIARDADHSEKKEQIRRRFPEYVHDAVLKPIRPEVYSHVNIMPSFPGGEEQLEKWLKNNLVYPQRALNRHIEGKVMLRFIVHTDGSITDLQIKKSADPLLDKEALRVIEKMPRWVPGQLGNAAVPVWCTLPIVFKMESE